MRTEIVVVIVIMIYVQELRPTDEYICDIYA